MSEKSGRLRQKGSQEFKANNLGYKWGIHLQEEKRGEAGRKKQKEELHFLCQLKN